MLNILWGVFLGACIIGLTIGVIALIIIMLIGVMDIVKDAMKKK